MKTNYTEHTGIHGNTKHSFVALTSWARQKFPSHVLKWSLTSVCFVFPVYATCTASSLNRRRKLHEATTNLRDTRIFCCNSAACKYDAIKA
ncbi:hypothetical protein P5673_016879 [Acropora cervicornis]|uniref:Uncharacterized protein n=1 Tax=Acropora cervicornis TaxID=6130 RepID=A0AAD9QFT7_ACRCE|nr:hypothetical protein P5673_016879 [Acropora cervicornis]